MAKKRDSQYYRRVLRRRYPVEFQKLQDGVHQSVRQAAAAAGLIKLPSRLDALKREWKKATATQQLAFVNWLKAGSYRAGVKKRSSTTALVDSSGRLRPAAITFITDWCVRTGQRPGRIMKEMGYSNYDYTLAQALRSVPSLRAEVIPKLSDWLHKQGFKD